MTASMHGTLAPRPMLLGQAVIRETSGLSPVLRLQDHGPALTKFNFLPETAVGINLFLPWSWL